MFKKLPPQSPVDVANTPQLTVRLEDPPNPATVVLREQRLFLIKTIASFKLEVKEPPERHDVSTEAGTDPEVLPVI